MEQNKMDCSADTGMCHRRLISGSAIIIGALVGVGLGFLLNLFIVAIGLSAFTTDKDGMIILAVGGLLGMMIGTIACMFTAGYAAGYLGRPYCLKHNLGIMYGFAAWALALILTVLLTGSMSRYVAAYSTFITNPATMMIMKRDMMMAETERTTVTKMTAVTSSKTTAVVPMDKEKMTNRFGMGICTLFLLFFIGALSSCLGGYYGMCRDCKE